MRPELLTMVANRGAFQYDDLNFEAQLGPREFRPMTTLICGKQIYEGEWLRDTEIPQGKCVVLYLDKFDIADLLAEGYWLNGKLNGKLRYIEVDGSCYQG